ncbi:hypothetical protein BGX38DRAFT_1206023 [Terfezia claveryi]|nr:hypothetical protein BGX38DRAFT_1206023 [Terfezia claveryi]
MASSDDEVTAPPKAEIKRITQGIQDAVKRHFQESGDAENLTVNSIRSKAEVTLELGKDFLRKDSYWRNESKTIIREEFERQNDSIEEGINPPPPKKDASRKKKVAFGKQKAEEPDPSEESQSPKKLSRRRAEKPKVKPVKRAVTPDMDKGNSEDEDEPPITRKRPRTKVISTPGKNDGKGSQTKTPDPEASDVEMAGSSLEEGKGTTGEHDGEGAEEKTGVDSESEMSEVLDITSKKKRQRTADTSKPRTTSKATTIKASAKGRPKKSKEATPVDADTEKIKELQGWLIKCGVRRLWGKELAKLPSAKEKINHLKGMLVDIGMTGRYSNDRARKIKEERELAADLEAVQQGAKAWGADNGETMKTRSSRTSEVPAKTRKLVRPPELAFLDNQSEESD